MAMPIMPDGATAIILLTIKVNPSSAIVWEMKSTYKQSITGKRSQ